MLGRRQTFSLMAGRCSAADADLKKTRDQKLYQGFARNWEECCTQHIGMSRANAERIIGLLEEFGPAYFEVAQLTRVSPETFRKLAPAIQNRTLHHNGEAVLGRFLRQRACIFCPNGSNSHVSSCYRQLT